MKVIAFERGKHELVISVLCSALDVSCEMSRNLRPKQEGVVERIKGRSSHLGGGQKFQNLNLKKALSYGVPCPPASTFKFHLIIF